MKQIADRHYFVGQGKKLGLELVLDENDNIFDNEIRIMKYLNSFKGNTLGLWKNSKGLLYIEPVLIIKDEKLEGVDTLRILKDLYPDEEAFYCAEIIGEEVRCFNSEGSLSLTIHETLYSLKANERVTLRWLEADDLWYTVKTVEGELVYLKK